MSAKLSAEIHGLILGFGCGAVPASKLVRALEVYQYCCEHAGEMNEIECDYMQFVTDACSKVGELLKARTSEVSDALALCIEEGLQ